MAEARTIMRATLQELDAAGVVQNGYDYALKVYVRDGIVQMCGHPARLRRGGCVCCNALRYVGWTIESARAHFFRGAERRA